MIGMRVTANNPRARSGARGRPMSGSISLRQKRAAHIRRNKKIRTQAEADKRKRVAEAKEAEAKRVAKRAANVERRRVRIIAEAKKHLLAFEKALEKLEADHVAMGRFRADRTADLDKRLTQAEDSLTILFRLNHDPLTALKGLARERQMKREHRLEERIRAIKIELSMVHSLR